MPTVEERLELHRLMFLLREFDAMLEQAVYFHSAAGEEAVPVGTFFGIADDDWAAPQYRGAEVVFYMRGAPLEQVAAQFKGRATSWSGGRAPAHCGDPERRFIPWVTGGIGTHIGVATGRAFAQKLDGDGGVTICSFGDGAVNSSSFHGAVNFAAIHRLPIVFVCQNNGFALSASVARSHGNPRIAERAPAYGIEGLAVDGNDVAALNVAVRERVELAREGGGPSLIEAQTYRMHGHIELDQAPYREAGDLERWAARDPLLISRAAIEAAGGEVETLEREAAAAVEAAFAAIEGDPAPGADAVSPELLFAEAS
jgi:TPP-dependent pyruvate/acetoin dehydrogenase alpha subunit